MKSIYNAFTHLYFTILLIVLNIGLVFCNQSASSHILMTALSSLTIYLLKKSSFDKKKSLLYLNLFLSIFLLSNSLFGLFITGITALIVALIASVLICCAIIIEKEKLLNIINCFSLMLSLIMMISFCLTNIIIINKYNKKEEYTFSSAEVYEKAKELLNSHEGYIIIDTYLDNNVLVVNDIEFDSPEELITFNTSEEMYEFIENKTLGIGVITPSFSGKYSFDDKNLTISYEESYTKQAIENESKEFLIDILPILIIASAVFSFVAIFVYNKGRKNVN